jgi:hypothetical protein
MIIILLTLQEIFLRKTGDLAAALDRQHHEDFEAQVRETERQRQEIERLHAELDAKKFSLQ